MRVSLSVCVSVCPSVHVRTSKLNFRPGSANLQQPQPKFQKATPLDARRKKII